MADPKTRNNSERVVNGFPPANGKPALRVVYTVPHRCFQVGSGRRYEADEAGEIHVEDAEDEGDLLRAGCRSQPVGLASAS